nr:ribonuclease H-like domain-containing protein [Tanacetum cinerariifolium]
MAFISSSKHSSGDEDGNTACVSIASTTFPTASASVTTISQDTASAYIASQSSGSQIKFKDINQIDEDDMEEIDIKWSMALLSMKADKFWKRTGKKISIQGSDVAGFDKSKVDYMENEGEDHALVADAEAPTEFTLMANTESKDGVDGKLAGLLKASKNLDNLIESQRSDKVKNRVGYNAVAPPAADLYLSPKKDLSWTGLPKFVDDTVTDYSRLSPTVASTSTEGQNKNSTTSEDVASPNTPKPFVMFVKPKDSQSKSKTNKQETPKKPQVKYAEQYRHSNKKPNVKGNQRN